MSIDIEEMKRGIASLEKVLEHAEKVRSWTITQGKTEGGDGGEYSTHLLHLSEMIQLLKESDWNVQALFNRAATDGCGEFRSLPFVGGWEEKVSEHLSSLDLN